MAQTRAPARRVDRVRHPNTLIVAPAMLDTLEHGRNQSFRLSTNNSGNPTHKKSSTEYADFSFL
jgi:hypothetical protein